MALTRYRMGGTSQQSDRPGAGRWCNEIESGDTIAALCPADGSVVPVSEGDRLWAGHLTTPQWLTAIDIGGTMYWEGSPANIPAEDGPSFQSGLTGATTLLAYGPHAPDASKVHVVSWFMTGSTQSGVHDGSNYLSFSLRLYGGSPVALFDTSGGLTTTDTAFVARIDEIGTNYADGASMSANVWAIMLRMDVTETGNIPATDIGFGVYTVAYIYE